MKLHTYFRSSAAYRMRIALNLKGIQAEMAFVHLLKDGGEQFSAAYDALSRMIADKTTPRFQRKTRAFVVHRNPPDSDLVLRR